MDEFYIRECVDGKTFAASVGPDFKGLGDNKCPFSGREFVEKVKHVTRDNAELMGLNYDQAVAGIKAKGIYFGKFKLDLGATMVIE